MINSKAVFSAAFFVGLLAVVLPNLWAGDKKSGGKNQSQSLNRLDGFNTMDANNSTIRSMSRSASSNALTQSVGRAQVVCDSLPKESSGGDLLFSGVCFGTDTMGISFQLGVISSSGVVSSSRPLAGPIPDNHGIYVRFYPTPSSDEAETFTACMRSPLSPYIRHLVLPMESTMINESADGHRYFGGFTRGQGLRIVLDPENKVREENESNNVINCTSFREVSRASEACIRFTEPGGYDCPRGSSGCGEGRPIYANPSRGYEGSCPYYDGLPGNLENANSSSPRR